MASRRTSLAVTLAPFVALVVVLAARPASAASCFEAIDPGTTQALFDRMVKAAPGDGCVLENVATEQSQLRVEWKKDGRVLEAILVVPTSCVTSPRTHARLSTIVPASVASSCPAAADTTESLVEQLATPALVTVHEATSVPVVVGQAPSHRALHRQLLAEGLLTVLVCIAAGLAFRRWRRWRALHPRVAPPELPADPAESAGAKARPRWQRNPGRAGWGAAILLAPHLALGTWLLLVPDHVAFTAAQIVTLLHVALALLALPFVGLWTFVHVQRMRTTRAPSTAGAITNRVLAGAVIVAAGTGLAVLLGGDIVRIAPLHAACGVAVGAPLAAHLWPSPRRWAAAAVASTLVVTALFAFAARRWLPETTAEATVPAFSYATRDASLYEPAESCRECHAEDYADWKRSIHARTLELPNVQESLGHAKDILGVSLTHVGELRTDPAPPASAAVTLSACGSCHAPTTFYGDEKQSMLTPAGVVAEGVGCSFCHTLRAVHESPPSGLDPKALPSGDVFAVMSRVPLFVSAPETVRRYLFQGSHDALAHRISNLLIRWRPEVHARDYDAKVMDDSRACLACHSLGEDSASLPHMTYYGWKVSPFVTADPKTTVECQDCHMTKHLTGAPAFDPGRMVPWGPVRPRTRSHLLLGGNVHSAAALGDEDLVRQEHALNAGALTVSITRAERVAEGVDATVAVHSNLVGHHFPAFETQLRYGWIELQAVDAGGNVVAKTPPPRDSQDFGSASPFIMASSDDPKPDNQRLVAPKATREFTGRVPVPAGVAIEKLVAVLHVSVDPDPLAVASHAL